MRGEILDGVSSVEKIIIVILKLKGVIESLWFYIGFIKAISINKGGLKHVKCKQI